MDFYKKISHLCEQKNITIKELERLLGFSNGIIGKWKTSSPNIKYLLEVCNFFDIGIEELCYNIDISKDEKLLHYFHESDERGQITILNVAELEAKRSREPEELKPFA